MPRIAPQLAARRVSAAALALVLAACGTGPAGAQQADMPFTLSEAGQFNEPWAMAFLPDGRALVTEKSGQLKLWREGAAATLVTGVPTVSYAGQGGLGDVALHPDFARNKIVYLSWAEAEGDVKGAAVGRAKLVEDKNGAVGRARDYLAAIPQSDRQWPFWPPPCFRARWQAVYRVW